MQINFHSLLWSYGQFTKGADNSDHDCTYIYILVVGIDSFF